MYCDFMFAIVSVAKVANFEFANFANYKFSNKANYHNSNIDN